MINRNLKRLMAARGLTAEMVAARLQGRGTDVTAGTVRAWMQGLRTPRFDHAVALASVLQCSMDDLTETKKGRHEIRTDYHRSRRNPASRNPMVRCRRDRRASKSGRNRSPGKAR